MSDMEKLLGPKCFLSSTFFLLSVLSTYGVVGIGLNYLQLSRVINFGSWPFNLRPAFIAFMIIQSLIPAAGLFGLLAACRKQALFLYCSGFVLLGVFTSSMVFGAVCIRTSTQDIVDDLYTTFKMTPNDLDLIKWFEDVQWQHRCCGIYGYEDWHQLKINGTQSEDAPSSCCQRRHDLCEKGALQSKNARDMLYTNGCGSHVSGIIREMSLRLGIEMWAVGGVSFIVAIFLLCGVTKLFIATGNSLSFNTMDSGSQRGANMMSSSQHPPSTSTDTNNNYNQTPSITSKSSFAESGRLKSSEIRRKRLSAKGPERKLSKKLLSLAPILSYNKLARSNNSSRQKFVMHANPSKSFILGEAHSNLMAPAGDGVNEANDPFLDMLWNQPIEKNMSTVSTTPNVISSMTVGDSTGYPTRRPGGPVDFTNMMMNDSSMKTTVFTLVSERAFTPSLSQDCSIPFYNDVAKQQNMEITALGQCSPHFLGGKQQRHIYSYPLPESEEEESEITQQQPLSIEQGNLSFQGTNGAAKSNDDALDNNTEVVNCQGANTGAAGPLPPLTTSKYLTSSVRSTTLATIHEESESVKGTPVNTKGSSPASGCMTPDADVSPQQTEIFHKDETEKESSVAQCPNQESIGLDNNNGCTNSTLVNSETISLEKQPQESLILEETNINFNDIKGNQETIIKSEGEQGTSVLSHLAERTMNVVKPNEILAIETEN